MNIEMEDFKTGWRDIFVGLRRDEIDQVIDLLKALKEDPEGHFHFTTNGEGGGGVFDIEFYVSDEQSKDNASVLGLPIQPNR